MNIKCKLILLYLFTFAIPFLIVSIVLSIWLTTTLKKRELEQARAAMQTMNEQFTDMLTGTTEFSDSLYTNRIVQQTILAEYKSPHDVYEAYRNADFLNDFLRADKDIISFRYYVENDTMLDSAFFIRTTKEIRNAEWYRNAKAGDGKILWYYKKDSISPQKYLCLVRSVLSYPENKFVGVLVINLDPEHIYRILRNQTLMTYLAINGKIAYSSGFMPKELSPSFLCKQKGQYHKLIKRTTWEAQRSAALIDYIPQWRSPDGIMQTVQIIPAKHLFNTTIQGILLCLLIMLCGSSFSIYFILLFSNYFNRRVNYVLTQTNYIVQNKLEAGPRLEGTDEFALIYDAIVVMSDNIKKLISEVYEHRMKQEQLQSRQNDIRFKMLASQINPHFLFNTLETIRMLSLADGNRNVAQTIKLLSKILRHNLAVTDRPVPVMEELDAISNYLDIQHLRFADRVSYDIICLTDVRTIGILPLLIQPIVENSFIHGLEQRKKGGFIYITIKENDDNDLIISVTDNGTGISEETLEELQKKLTTGTVETISSSIGMINVHQRIKLFYGPQYGLEIQSKLGKGTTVIIHIPAVQLPLEGNNKHDKTKT